MKTLRTHKDNTQTIHKRIYEPRHTVQNGGKRSYLILPTPSPKKYEDRLGASYLHTYNWWTGRESKKKGEKERVRERERKLEREKERERERERAKRMNTECKVIILTTVRK